MARGHEGNLLLESLFDAMTSGHVLVSTEMYVYPVANSFREFLEGLYEPPDA